MQLKRLSIKNFMGVRNLEIKPAAPITFLVGPNGAGKSSTVEAVRAAMQGRIDRVALKKEYGAIVTEGERIGTVLIDHDGGRCGMTLPNGAHEIEGDPLNEPALPFVLDAHLFASIDEGARRTFLHDLLGISTSPNAIVERLAKEYDCAASLLNDIKPLLTRGFDAALKHAKEQVSESRGAWKAVTGEAYGEKKAEHWAPPEVERPSDDAIAAAQEAERAAMQAAHDANVALGTVQAEAKTYRERRAKREDLEHKAGRLNSNREQLVRGESEHKAWKEKLDSLPPEPGDVSIRPPMACPECGSMLTLRDGALHPHEDGKLDDDETATKRKQWGDAVALYARTIESAKRDILTAERAKVELADLDALTPVLDSDVAEARERAEAARHAHAVARETIDAIMARHRAATERESRIQMAQTHHADALAWGKIADGLAPDGLRTRIVSDAIDPVNKTLLTVADTMQWPAPQIGADMQIRVGASARPLKLLSESEQWRVDTIIAIAIARLSGLKLVLLDRFDVLEPDARLDLVFGLSDLVGAGILGQAIAAGTLKSAPDGLPENCEAVWIGPVAEVERAAA